MSERKTTYETAWDATRVLDLRRRLGLSQQALADELGVRQQTVSDWETGVYAPRGASRRVLRMVAEQAAEYAPSVVPQPRRTPRRRRASPDG